MWTGGGDIQIINYQTGIGWTISVGLHWIDSWQLATLADGAEAEEEGRGGEGGGGGEDATRHLFTIIRRVCI